jgi:hypothetical protein
MRNLLFGDASGGSRYHVGDEAMLSVNFSWLRSEWSEAEAILVSQDPDFTAGVHRTRGLPVRVRGGAPGRPPVPRPPPASPPRG